MPIPIPIPMPMGPSGGGGKFHNHFHQQQHRQRDNEGEGEVKKIYLLQPMPKVVPQPQLKGGGFMGPVQTHIHMQPIQQHHTTKSRHSHSSKDYGIETGGQNQNQIEETAGTKTSKVSHHSSEIKILPIVIIPPIAPVPPIQIPPNNNIHTPRMTLTPQFNNYVVSTKEGKRNPYTASHIATMLQDHKSFSDYGGSGGASMYRGSVSRGRLKSGGRISRPTAAEYSQSASRQRSRARDDYDDDYDYPVQTEFRHSRRSMPSSSRRRSYLDQTGNWRSTRPPRDSIRDILDQQVSFDDDLSIDSNEYRDVAQINSIDCCNELRRPRSQLTSSSNLYNLDNIIANSNQEQRDVIFNDYDDNKSSASTKNTSKMSVSSQPDYDDSALKVDKDSSNSHHRNSDLSSLYYDRDLRTIDQQPQASSSHRSAYPSNGHRSHKLRIDDREILDDDEWRFDSVKSVTHANPSTNTTTVALKTPAATVNGTNVIFNQNKIEER